jgi:dTDP-glucose 4,6-dehydratase
VRAARARLPASTHRPHAGLITHVVDRPGHDRRYDLDCGLIERELGWRPRHDLATGLAATVDWYLAAGAWLAAIRDSDDFRRWLTLNYADRGAGAP